MAIDREELVKLRAEGWKMSSLSERYDVTLREIYDAIQLGGHFCRCGCGAVLFDRSQYALGHKPEQAPGPGRTQFRGPKPGEIFGGWEVIGPVAAHTKAGGSVVGKSAVRCRGCSVAKTMQNDKLRLSVAGCKKCYGQSHDKPIRVGDTRHWWTVIATASPVGKGQPAWLCECKCGRQKVLAQCNLTGGLSKRCRSCASKRLPM